MKALIVGGGPAAISTAKWAKKLGVPFDWAGAAFGGTLQRVHNPIDDFPPTLWPSGPALTESLKSYADASGLKMTAMRVDSLWKTPEGWRIETSQASVKYEVVVLATGSVPNAWTIEGQADVADLIRLSSSKAPTEFQGRRVAVVGGGDGALEAALRLAEHCQHVDVFVRSQVRARRSYVAATSVADRITIHEATTLAQAHREDSQSCRLVTDDGRSWDVAAIYLKLGIRANLPKINPTITRDKSGYVVVDAEKKTSQDGLYAVGDVTSCHIRSVSNALADGVICARALADLYESIRLRTR